MLISTVYPSKYVTAADLQGRTVTLTIKAVTLEEMLTHDSKKATKPVAWFERTEKGFVMNMTNAKIIAALYGDDTAGWIGERISLYPTRVKAFGTVQDCIRVREEIPAKPKPPAQTAVVEEPSVDDDEDVADYQEEGDSPRVDPETGEILEGKIDGDVLFAKDEAHESPPHKRLWAIGISIFGKDWDMARPWVIRQWTEINSMGENIVESARDLSEDQKSMLGDYMYENTAKLQKIWPAQKKVMERRVANAKVAA